MTVQLPYRSVADHGSTQNFQWLESFLWAEINSTGLSSAQIDALYGTVTPPNGLVVSDPTNHLLLCRQGGKWYKTAALTVIP